MRPPASTVAIIAVTIIAAHGVDEAGEGKGEGVEVGVGVGSGVSTGGNAGGGLVTDGAIVVNVPITQVLVSVINRDRTLQ